MLETYAHIKKQLDVRQARLVFDFKFVKKARHGTRGNGVTSGRVQPIIFRWLYQVFLPGSSAGRARFTPQAGRRWRGPNHS